MQPPKEEVRGSRKEEGAQGAPLADPPRQHKARKAAAPTTRWQWLFQ